MSLPAAKPKVLIIDDSEIVLEVTRGALEGAGYEVVTHDRPGGSVALILSEKPDLVLMDVQMPGLGGDTIVAVLRKAQPEADTVVLLHSSLPVDVLRHKVTASGANGYVQKSGDIFGLVRDLARWLKGRTSSGNMRTAAAFGAGEEPRASGSWPIAGRPSAASGTASPSREPGATAASRRSSGTRSLNMPSALLVDEDMGVLGTYRDQLKSEELLVEFALSGRQALRRILSDKPPAVVLLDFQLRDLAAAELYRQAVAADPGYQQRFILVASSRSLPSLSAFLSEFSGPFLNKPIERGELLAALSTCLSAVRSSGRATC